MDDVREATSDFLAENPDADDALEEILAVDEDGSWNFDDISLDSGTFGEIVSRGIVESTDDGYRVPDPTAVRAALNGDAEGISDGADHGFDLSSVRLPEIEPRNATALAGVVVLVFLVRTVLVWPSVFLEGDIALAGNDPYYYRYWVDTLLGSDLAAFDVGSLARLPEGVANSDVLFIVVTWWTASLLGEPGTASGLVLAWYPVVAAVVNVGILYLFAVRLTNDRRIGVASALLLAVLPAHGYRSMLGFGDHHAFDFVWLTLVALSLSVVLARDGHRPLTLSRIVPAIGFGVGISAQAAAWRGGPILLLPVAVTVAAFVYSAVRADRSPLAESRLLVVGLGVGAAVSLCLYGLFGWMQFYRGVAPSLLLVGSVGTVVLGHGWYSIGRPAREFGLVLVSITVLGLASIWVFVPELRDPIELFVQFTVGQRDIAETLSLFSGALGSVVGPLLVFGLTLFLALPYLSLLSWRVVRRHEPVWLPPVVFGWFLLGLTVVQLRYAGEQSVFTALFAGIGLVDVAHRVELADPVELFNTDRVDISIPDTTTLGSLVVLFLLVSSLGVIQTGVKQQQLQPDRTTITTATWINEYASDRDMEYPENYVLSEWGESRVYNYHVNGQSESYSFARNTYGEFARSGDRQIWYERLRNDVGFVIVDRSTTRYGSGTTHQALRSHVGSSSSDSGFEHYRAVYVPPDGDRVVYELVEGATITGVGSANSTISIASTIDLGHAQTEYRRQFESTRRGWYTVTVSQPGTYSIDGERVTITEREIRRGALIARTSTNGSFYWSFDESDGDIAYEVFGANHGELRGVERTPDGVDGAGLQFDAEETGFMHVDLHDGGPNQFTASLWVRPTALDTTAENDPRYLIRTGGENVVLIEETGAVSFRVPGVTSENFRAGNVAVGEWTHLAVSYNGTHRMIYVDGRLVDSEPVPSGDTDWGENLLIGGEMSKDDAFAGTIDEIRLYDDVLNATEVRTLSQRNESRP